KFAPLKRVQPSVPEELDDIVTRSLFADRDRRPTSVAEFADILAKLEERLISGDIPLAPEQAPAPAATGSRADRRANSRVLVKVPVAFVPFHENKRTSFQATILDFSPGGICLQSNESVAIRTLLEITVASNGELYLVEVRWAKPAADGSHILGCSFACLPE